VTIASQVNDRPTPASPDEFAPLFAAARAEGLLSPRPGYYVRTVAFNLVALAAAWWLFARVGNSWWQMAVAVLLAFFYTQIGFVGHDIGHREVTRRPRLQNVLGFLHGDLLLGFSFDWWVAHHNRHHGHPNHLERDSDITRRRVIFTPEQGFLRKGRAKQFIVRHQHVLFFPLLSTEAVGLRVASFKAIRNGTIRRRRLEALLVGAHLAAYLSAVLIVLPPLKALAFVAVHQLAFGLYIGSVFAPNHKGMPLERPGDNWDWLNRQVRTSRNIRSNRLTDYLFGGLNYQIEHHLFPGMPRPNLRRARMLTRQHCAQTGLPYHEVSAYASYAEVICHLRQTSRAYRTAAGV
jgi:fatty acid desaturase